MAFSLHGMVTSPAGSPIANASVRLIGFEHQLGWMPGAVTAPASESATTVVWQRPLTGLTGNRWQVWERFVKDQVRGIKWTEFRDEVVRQNPSLAQGRAIFRATQVYRLPENITGSSILWNRTLTGFQGTRWSCWEQVVKDQVQGLSWQQFVEPVLEYNPVLKDDGHIFKKEKTYLLPRNQKMSQSYLFQVTDSLGRYRFDSLPEAGPYQIVVKSPQEEFYEYGAVVMGQREKSYNIQVQQKIIQEPQPAPPQQPTASAGPAHPWQPTAPTAPMEPAAPWRPAPPPPQPVVPHHFIQTKSGHFTLNNRAFRFVGANIRGLLHYGDRRILQFSDQTRHPDIQLNAASQMGAKVVRVFGANRHSNTKEIGNRLQQALDRVAARDMYLILAFTDVHHDTGFNVPGDGRFYQDNRLNKAWYEAGYRQNYLPFVEYIVQRFKDHPRILAWELGNELKAWAPGAVLPELFIRFAKEVSNRIRQLDPNHLITTGIINSGNLGCNHEQARRLYQLPNLDFLTAHVYYSQQNSNQWMELEAQRAEQDADLARQLMKPFIIEEIGFEGGDRVQQTEQHLQKWFDQKKIGGLLQWGLMATNQDMGDGDNRFGVHGNHPDYGRVISRLGNRAKRLYQAL
ncbi:MAG: cellulase family glycosylhydrolase [Ardenticatenaceae bacterium]